MHLPFAAADLPAPWTGAAMVGVMIGTPIIVYAFAIYAIVKAFQRKSTTWIVVGSISGFTVLTTWVLAITLGGVASYNAYQNCTPKVSRFVPSSIPHEMQGWKMAYKIVLPEGWTPDWSDGDFDMTTVRDGLHVGIVAGESVGNTDAIEDMARRKIQTVPRESHVDASTPVRIDGRTWQQFTARSRMAPAATEVYRRFYVYSGVEGMFQVVGWRTDNFQGDDADALHDIAQSFRFPTGPSPPTPMPLTVQGSRAAYQLIVPAGWTVDRSTAFDLMMKRLSSSLRVNFITTRNGVAETFLHSTQDFIRHETNDLHLSETSTVRIGGRDWLHYTATYRFKELPCTQEYYVYVEPEGVFQMIGLIQQGPSQSDESTLHDLVMSFRFPPPVITENDTAAGGTVSD